MRRITKNIFLLSLLFFVLGASGLAYFFFKQQSFQIPMVNMVPFQETRQWEAGPISKLAITTNTPNVAVLPGETGEIRVQLEGHVPQREKEQIVFDTQLEEGGILRIRAETTKKLGLSLDFTGLLTVKVMVPEKEFERLSVTTATGDIQLQDLAVKLGNVESATGDVQMVRVKAEEMKVTTQTGDVDSQAIHAMQTLNSETGDIVVRTQEAPAYNLEARSSTGDVSVIWEADATSLEVDAKTDTGTVHVALPRANFSEQQKQKVQGALGSNGPTLHLRSATGDIVVKQDNERGS